MKLIILFIIFSTTSFASKHIGKCRYDLLGPQTLGDQILEKELLSIDKCEKAARKMLELNREHYNKIVLKHSLEKKPRIIE